MSVTRLLLDLRTRGVEVSAHEDRLRLAAPRGVLSPALVEIVRAEKSALLALLEAEALGDMLSAWACDDAARWKRVHTVLLQSYHPRWEQVNGHDVLVAWAGARRAAMEAAQKVSRLRSLQTRGFNQAGELRGAVADAAFFGRVADRLQAEVAQALVEAPGARRMLSALLVGESEEAQS